MTRTTIPLLLFATLSYGAPRPKDLEKESVYFPTKVGTRLVYQVGSSEDTQVVSKVVEKDGNKVVHVERLNLDGTTESVMVVRVGPKGLFLLEESGEEYDPPLCWMKLPVREGENSTSSSNRRDLGNLIMTRTVGKPEKLKVMAGTFSAVPLTVSWLIDKGIGIGQEESVHWFAPDLGQVKITKDGKTTKELKSVTSPGEK